LLTEIKYTKNQRRKENKKTRKQEPTPLFEKFSTCRNSIKIKSCKSKASAILKQNPKKNPYVQNT
jgi:hypothetical protein